MFWNKPRPKEAVKGRIIERPDGLFIAEVWRDSRYGWNTVSIPNTGYSSVPPHPMTFSTFDEAEAGLMRAMYPEDYTQYYGGDDDQERPRPQGRPSKGLSQGSGVDECSDQSQGHHEACDA